MTEKNEEYSFGYMLRLFAEINRNCGYKQYADILDNEATVQEAKTILKEGDNNDPKS